MLLRWLRDRQRAAAEGEALPSEPLAADGAPHDATNTPNRPSMRREDSVASNCSDVTVKARPIGDGSERDVDSDVEQVEDGVDLLYTRHEPTASRTTREPRTIGSWSRPSPPA